MLAPALLALSLVVGQADPGEDDWGDEDEGRGPEVFVTAWGGNAWNANGGNSVGVLGGEFGLGFGGLDLGVAGYGYHVEQDATGGMEWRPVILARVGQRFQSYRGLEGSLIFGLGAARLQRDEWRSWFQVALGVRINIEPLYVAGEITFEQDSLIRLTGGLGFRF